MLAFNVLLFIAKHTNKRYCECLVECKVNHIFTRMWDTFLSDRKANWKGIFSDVFINKLKYFLTQLACFKLLRLANSLKVKIPCTGQLLSRQK